MENSDVLEVCAFNACWQIARRSQILTKALEKTKWTELISLFDACHKQDCWIEPNSTLSLRERARRGESVEIPDQHLVCAVEMCEKLFAQALAKGYELIGEGIDARDVMVWLVGMICEEVDRPRNTSCQSVCEFQIPATPGGAPSTISESFKILSVGYPGGIGIQRAFDKWMAQQISSGAKSNSNTSSNMSNPYSRNNFTCPLLLTYNAGCNAKKHCVVFSV